MKKLLALFAATLFVLTAGAQYKWEYGLKVGGANYLGDIGGKFETRRDFVWDMHINQTRYAFGGYGRYKFSRRLAVSANLDHIRITDADRHTTNPARQARNLNFRNNMWELGLRGEFTVFYDNDVGGKGYYNPDFKLFVFAGVAGFYHNPQGQIFDNGTITEGGKWYDLHPWQTEGVEYSRLSIAIPAGIGMYFTFNKKWRIGWELSWRTTFTDYIDDLSSVYVDPATYSDPLAADFASQSYEYLVNQVNEDYGTNMSVNDHRFNPSQVDATKRGDATNNDSYLTTQLTIGKVIRGRSSYYRRKYGWMRGVRKSRAKF